MAATLDFADLHRGTLVRRYKRFLADVDLDAGERVTAHCPNTGAMTGCADPGSKVWLSHTDNPKRKLSWTWELVESPEGFICIHSTLANRVVQQALEVSDIFRFDGFTELKPEVSLPTGGRVDFRLTGATRSLWLEVKAVSWLAGSGLGLFPDSVSTRARKHVRELMEVMAGGDRAALVFCVFHTGIERVAPAVQVDPVYAELLGDAQQQGLEMLGLAVDISPSGLQARGFLDVELP